MAAIATLVLSGASQAYTDKSLYSFCSVTNCADGAQPTGELAMDQAGNVYGTTSRGGTGYVNPGGGTVFQFTPATGQYNVLYSFCEVGTCSDGLRPAQVKLVIDTAGNLYGTTSKGGNGSDAGVVFELIHRSSGWREKILYTFCSRRKCRDGGAPVAGLTYSGAATGQLYDGTSPLYGTTEGGGDANSNGYGGTVFSLTPKPGTKKWVETVLYSFCAQTGCPDGAEPDSALFLDSAGNLYGTTLLGGRGWGTIFEITPGDTGYTETVLNSFCSQQYCVDGANPVGGVVMDNAGNLFGTAEGGESEDGLIFEVSPIGGQWQYNVLASFDGSNGSTPESPLVLDTSGNLFGTTQYGGSPQKKGTVFEFNGAIQTLYSFCAVKGCPDGKNPVAGVIEDSAGNLYGATSGGANHDSGTIFELSVQRSAGGRRR